MIRCYDRVQRLERRVSRGEMQLPRPRKAGGRLVVVLELKPKNPVGVCGSGCLGNLVGDPELSRSLLG